MGFLTLDSRHRSLLIFLNFFFFFFGFVFFFVFWRSNRAQVRAQLAKTLLPFSTTSSLHRGRGDSGVKLEWSCEVFTVITVLPFTDYYDFHEDVDAGSKLSGLGS